MMEYSGIEYDESIERAGDDFQLSHLPRIAGIVLGYNADSERYLVRLTVPYGENSKVYMAVHRVMLEGLLEKLVRNNEKAKS